MDEWHMCIHVPFSLLPPWATGNSSLSIQVQAFGFMDPAMEWLHHGNCTFNFFVEPPNFSTVAALLKEPTGVFISAPPTHTYFLFLSYHAKECEPLGSGQLIAEPCARPLLSSHS